MSNIIEFSIINSVTDKNPVAKKMTFEVLFKTLEKTYNTNKVENILAFKENKKIKQPKRINGSVFELPNNRKAENIKKTSLVIFDIDLYPASIDILKKDIKEEFKNKNYIIYTTSNCTANKPRCRLILPLENAILSSQYKELVLNFVSNIKNLNVKKALNSDLPANCDVAKVFALPYYNVENIEYENVHLLNYVNSGQNINSHDFLELEEAKEKEEVKIEYLKPPVNLTDSEIIEVLNKFDVKEIDYDKWLKIGIALHHQYGGNNQGLGIWNIWSSKDKTRYKGYNDLKSKWETFTSNKNNSYTFRSIIKEAKDSDRIMPISRSKFLHTEGKQLLPATTIENFQIMLKCYNIKAFRDIILKTDCGYINNKLIKDKSVFLYTIKSLMNLNKMSSKHAQEFLTITTEKNKVNGWRDFILSKSWDGKCRLNDIYNTVKVKPDYVKLRDLFIYKWLVQMVHITCMNDNATKKARNVLIFKGKQRIGKTSWLENLVPVNMNEYKQEGCVLNTNNEVSKLTAISHVFVEIGEMTATFKKSDQEALKNFLSMSVDAINMKYEPLPRYYTRHTVYFGSTNDDNFLIDLTGTDRFWVLPVENCNAFHEIDLQQLYAQLYETCKNVDYNLTPDETYMSEVNNKDYMLGQPLEELFINNFDLEKECCQWKNATEILRLCGYVGNIKKADMNIMVCILRKLQYKRRKNDGRFCIPPKKDPESLFDELADEALLEKQEQEIEERKNAVNLKNLVNKEVKNGKELNVGS